jgi:hypothetical protein
VPKGSCKIALRGRIALAQTLARDIHWKVISQRLPGCYNATHSGFNGFKTRTGIGDDAADMDELKPLFEKLVKTKFTGSLERRFEDG